MNFSVSALKTQSPEDDIDEAFAQDIIAGLSGNPKRLPSKYFYDDKGSQLFQQITRHPDYYPTRTELEIIKSLQHELPKMFDEEIVDVVELGAGDGHKTQLILDGFLQAGRQVNYLPIDISRQAMSLLEATIEPHDALTVHGIVAEYIEGLSQVPKLPNRTRIVVFLGSNLGNFDLLQSASFLQSIRSQLSPGDHLLIGFDMKKNIEVLTRAYNDSSGLTREFNMNLLRRINRELGGNFEIGKFDHVGIYNPVLGAMESFLIATEALEVSLDALGFKTTFAAYEPIHTEYSFKFLQADIEKLSADSGFEITRHFQDAKHYFIDSLWRAV